MITIMIILKTHNNNNNNNKHNINNNNNNNKMLLPDCRAKSCTRWPRCFESRTPVVLALSFSTSCWLNSLDLGRGPAVPEQMVLDRGEANDYTILYYTILYFTILYYDMYVYVCIYIYIYMYTYVYISLSLYIYIYMYIVYISIYIYIYTYIYIYIYIYNGTRYTRQKPPQTLWGRLLSDGRAFFSKSLFKCPKGVLGNGAPELQASTSIGKYSPPKHALMPCFTIPQRGVRKGGSYPKITRKSLLRHLNLSLVRIPLFGSPPVGDSEFWKPLYSKVMFSMDPPSRIPPCGRQRILFSGPGEGM